MLKYVFRIIRVSQRSVHPLPTTTQDNRAYTNRIVLQV